MSEQTTQLPNAYVSFLLFDQDGFNGGGNTILWMNLTEITRSSQIRHLEATIAKQYNMKSAQVMAFTLLPDEPEPEPKKPSVIVRVK
ncbi:MAG: hypothetical protein K2X77_18450 [Candidatus Obscuribacterales bacterium]|jgi:hypothetical protein|nr:hypothetical protein [Candidatus Obscuribacterales bacterium]